MKSKAIEPIALRTILKLAYEMTSIYLDIELDCPPDRKHTRNTALERRLFSQKETLKELQRQARRGELFLQTDFTRRAEAHRQRIARQNLRDQGRLASQRNRSVDRKSSSSTAQPSAFGKQQ